MAESTLDDVYFRAERIVGRRIGDGFVLVPLASRGADLDAIFELNATAAFVWEQLDGARDGRAIVTAVVERFEVEAEQAAADYLELMDALKSIGAARLVAGATTTEK